MIRPSVRWSPRVASCPKGLPGVIGPQQLQYAPGGKYPGANGVKIGSTRRAGQAMVASARRAGVWLIAVVFGSKDRDEDTARLLDQGFSKAGYPAL